jgi:hypothetical protein
MPEVPPAAPDFFTTIGDLDPGIEQYFVTSRFDDPAGVMASYLMGVRRSVLSHAVGSTSMFVNVVRGRRSGLADQRHRRPQLPWLPRCRACHRPAHFRCAELRQPVPLPDRPLISQKVLAKRSLR